MKYKEIVAVTGLSGLYQLLTTKSDGAVVRSIADKTTKFISARKHNVTPLDSIEVYTTGENVKLETVFRKITENEANIALIDTRTANNNQIKAYFKSIFPEFDEDRVYVSDMKKMVKWYEILKANDLLEFDGEAEAKGDKMLVGKMENEYINLVKKLLIDKVITFSCGDCSEDHTGICEYVEFLSGFELILTLLQDMLLDLQL
jgi:hypothetical protein